LVGVVVHMGTADVGHYISYINTNRDLKDSDPGWSDTNLQNWFEFNDSKVEKFDFSQMEYKCFGESTLNKISTSATYVELPKAKEAHNAYMLVYEKRRKVDLTIVLDQSSLVCDSTATPRG
jgi:ubiquitin carboxyl-terminal hydrolase 34